MFDWFQLIYAICTSGATPPWWREIGLAANLATALAYFWIPAVMAVVFSRWREELPYRWLWVGFVTFITACGVSHVFHAVHLLRAVVPHTAIELAVLVITAAVSLITAAGFTFILPKVLRLSSPAAARRRLEEAVETATNDLHQSLEHKRLLLLEVHHRVGNNLQIISSLINLHMRKHRDQSAELRTLRDRVAAISAVHEQLERVDASALSATGLLTSLAGTVNAGRVDAPTSIEISGEDFLIPLDLASGFALILHEVVDDARRRLSDSPQASVIEIGLSADGNARSVSVRYHARGPLCENAAFASKIIGALAVQLGAEVEWSEESDNWLTFTMRFEEPAIASRLPPAITEAHPVSGRTGMNVREATASADN